MRFEVIDSRDGKVKMSTGHRSCIYPLDTLRSMEFVGYKFRLNGKRWKPGQDIPDEPPKAAPRKAQGKRAVPR